jgi:hypothetical protein
MSESTVQKLFVDFWSDGKRFLKRRHKEQHIEHIRSLCDRSRSFDAFYMVATCSCVLQAKLEIQRMKGATLNIKYRFGNLGSK